MTHGEHTRRAMTEEKTPPLFTKGKTPPFTERRKLLEKIDVNWNRELYLARISRRMCDWCSKEKIYPSSKYINFPHT